MPEFDKAITNTTMAMVLKVFSKRYQNNFTETLAARLSVK